MVNPKLKREKRVRRHRRVRAKISGTSKVPRLCVFRSAKHIYAQLIDDEKGKTLVSVSDLKIKGKNKRAEPKTTKKPVSAKVSEGKPSIAKAPESKEEKRSGKIALAYEAGKLIAEKAIKKKIKKVVFDRGACRYHGRVKAVAEGAREGGLIF